MSIDFSTLDQQRLLAERVKRALSKIEDKTDLLSVITIALDTYIDGVNDKVDDLSIPTKTSELTNDAKFQTDTDVANAIANADKLTRRKIDSLSDIDLTADDAEDFIYMLGVTDTDGNTYYQQYMVINGAVEAMGTTMVDLEGYLTEDDVATDDEVDAEIEEPIDIEVFKMPICVNPNLFRNGTLLKPIDQRGKGTYTGIGYGFDGWYAYHAQTTVTKTSDGLDVTNSALAANAVVGQIISTSDLLPGQYTLSALSTAGFTNIEVWSGSRKLFEIPPDKFFSKQIYIDSTWTHSQIRFNFYMKPGSKFVGAKLERGDRQTAVYKDLSGAYVWIECPDFGNELRRCMEYQIELVNPFNKKYGLLGTGPSYKNEVNISVPVPVLFRKKPSVSFSGEFRVVQTGLWVNGVKVVDVRCDQFTSTSVTLVPIVDSLPNNGLWSFAYVDGLSVQNSLFLDANIIPA